MFDRFLKDSIKGKRLQKNGNRIRKGSIKNYSHVRKTLVEFSEKESFELRLKPFNKLSKRDCEIENRYWKKFYSKYTNYLYSDLVYYDNSVGLCVKVIRTFFNYLNDDLNMSLGNFYKKFYVNKEDIEIIVLPPERLNYLIYDQNFESTLNVRLKKIKDVFVFGCTVGLRVSDLMKLKNTNLSTSQDGCYLTVWANKTGITTRIKLPDYAIKIIKKYSNIKKTLLPYFNNVNLNIGIKQLMEKANWIEPCYKTRNKRGMPIELLKNTNSSYRFCDRVTSHTMRRTAISTMLCLGMPENFVRKISGHSANSKEFFKYVEFSQKYIDQATDKVFEILNTKVS